MYFTQSRDLIFFSIFWLNHSQSLIESHCKQSFLFLLLFFIFISFFSMLTIKYRIDLLFQPSRVSHRRNSVSLSKGKIETFNYSMSPLHVRCY